MNSKRNINDDLIRVISVILVISIHTWGRPWQDNVWASAVLLTIIYTCNTFFFMLSGKYNLRKEFNSPSDYLTYYKKKVPDILLPYAILSFILSGWNFYLQGLTESSGFVMFIKFALKEFFSENASTHLWFMFLLLGYLLSAPFLSKMLHAMSDKELGILFGIGLAWNIVYYYLFMDFWHNFSYGGWILTGWIMYFVGGHYIDRVTASGDPKVIRSFYIAGLIGFIVNVVASVLMAGSYFDPTGLAPAFMLFCAGAYVFLGRLPSIKNEIAVKVISFIAKHSFAIYLIQFHIANNITPKIVTLEAGVPAFAAGICVTFVLSLAAAFVIDLVLAPIKAGLKKLLKI